MNLFSIDYTASSSDLAIRTIYKNISHTVLEDVSRYTVNNITGAISTSGSDFHNSFDNLNFIARVYLEGVYDFILGLDNGYLVIIPNLPTINTAYNIRRLTGFGYFVGCKVSESIHSSISTNIINLNTTERSVSDVYNKQNIPSITSGTTFTVNLIELPNLLYNIKSKRSIAPYTNYALSINTSNPVSMYYSTLYQSDMDRMSIITSNIPVPSTNFHILLV